MDAARYCRLMEGKPLPDLADHSPFKAMVISDIPSTPEWRSEVGSWLVAQGCLYMMAWGHECEAWHDAVDWAVVGAYGGEIPDEKFVMTTWHEDESLEEVFWFAKLAAEHPDVVLDQQVILHVSNADRCNELVASFESVGVDAQAVSAGP